MSTTTALPLSPKDFATDQEVRWCPGCGDYSILAQMKKVLAPIGIAREKTVFISGIGCSSRFPYYMNTYGFHSIHGRAPAFATGLKVANPELSVWVITGDGDGLSIGGNHLLHTMRRNIDLKIVLFNNEIYGLTKGQYSPTSRTGTRTKSSPTGSVEDPLPPLTLALAAGATFVARTTDVDIKHLAETLTRAAHHKGAAFVEVYQNCKIFNDGVFEYATDKSQRADNLVYLEHGKPLVYGSHGDKGLRFNVATMELEPTTAAASDLVRHDEATNEPTLAMMLSRLRAPDHPEAMGVLRCVNRPTYEADVHRLVDDAIGQRGPGDLRKLFRNDDTWVVE
jgi:2-oxoglutarate/2-oxoacid ferredoxin oxidoreductase subunit beta